MIQMLVATLMWALVASLLIFRRKRTDRSITRAAFTIAIAMTLNVDGIYTVVDPLLGGTNIATLIADALLMTGLFFLGRGVMKSGKYRPRLVRAAVSVPVLLVALLAITAAFLFIDRGTTTTRFMSDLGAQPAAAVYSIINFSYGALVIATMLVLATRQYRDSAGIQRLPATLLSLGSAFGVALCLAVIVLDIAHATGHLDLMHAIQAAYDPLSVHLCVPLRRIRGPARGSPRPEPRPASEHDLLHGAVGAALAPSDTCTARAEPGRPPRHQQRRPRRAPTPRDSRNPRRNDRPPHHLRHQRRRPRPARTSREPPRRKRQRRRKGLARSQR